MRELLGALPADYPAAMFIVVHLAPEAPSILPDILNRVSAMPVTVARSGARIRPGTVTVAPPDLHLILMDDAVMLAHGPRENRHRPSIDVLFRSAAVAFGPRVTGVVLSGMLDDGAAGLWAIKRRGGIAVVQDPADAEFPDMPRNALEVTDVDHRVAIREMASTLVGIAREPVGPAKRSAGDMLEREVRMATQGDHDGMEELDQIGQRVPYTCPECGGSLWEVGDGGPRFRCHNGHAYSLKTLVSEQSIQVEAALWAGLRRLEESERLARRMASEARSRGNPRSAEFHEDVAKSTASHADVLRRLLADATSGKALKAG